MKGFLLVALVCVNIHKAVDSTAVIEKVTPGGTISFSIWTNVPLMNVLLYRKDESGQYVEVVSATYSGKTFVFAANFRGRTKVVWSSEHDLTVEVSNAKNGDGGKYFIRAPGDHQTTNVSYQVYIVGSTNKELCQDRPFAPFIKIIGGVNKTINEGSYARFVCDSTSTTYPRNPDWPLIYIFEINGTKQNPALDSQTRVMVRNNELMLGEVSKEDDFLNLTCTVQENNGMSMSASTSFKLRVSENKMSKNTSTASAAQQDGNIHTCAGWTTGTFIVSAVFGLPMLFICLKCLRKRWMRNNNHT